jgi:hypothetical protein
MVLHRPVEPARRTRQVELDRCTLRQIRSNVSIPYTAVYLCGHGKTIQYESRASIKEGPQPVRLSRVQVHDLQAREAKTRLLTGRTPTP